ncbi:hypothetical protein BDV18DRAFT_143119 [Aspergillus unguis]
MSTTTQAQAQPPAYKPFPNITRALQLEPHSGWTTGLDTVAETSINEAAQRNENTCCSAGNRMVRDVKACLEERLERLGHRSIVGPTLEKHVRKFIEFVFESGRADMEALWEDYKEEKIRDHTVVGLTDSE